jgi:arsenate reductase
MLLLPSLDKTIENLLARIDQIPEARKTLLQRLVAFIDARGANPEPVQLVFICTHNSRRSLIAQIWAAAAAARFGLENLACYSGGTEATAFNPRAVAAMKRAGFDIVNPGGDNPAYRVRFAEHAPPLTCFSKTYGASSNPTTGFAAIMTCSEADENCPYIPGAAFRLSLPYEDPKIADDTSFEAERYDERVRQIGQELLYVMQKAAH